MMRNLLLRTADQSLFAADPAIADTLLMDRNPYSGRGDAAETHLD